MSYNYVVVAQAESTDKIEMCETLVHASRMAEKFSRELNCEAYIAEIVGGYGRVTVPLPRGPAPNPEGQGK